MRRDPPINRAHHLVQTGLHQRVVETQKPDTECLKPALPLLISVPFQRVTLPVDLDREHQLTAVEIHDIFVDWTLTVEIMATLAATQTLPKQHLAERAFLPQLAGESFKPRIVF